MPAKNWANDFRREAIGASLQLLQASGIDEPSEAKFSYCVPVNDRPIVGWTPGRIIVIAMVVGFVLMVFGLLLMASEKRWPGAEVLGGCIGFSGCACFFVVFFDRPLLRRLLGARGDQLASRSGTTSLLSAEISNRDLANKLSIDSDDYALIFIDRPGGRLLIEGLSCRYQVFASDVEAILPFEFANYLGVQILFRIGPQVRLEIVAARASTLLTLIQQAPLLFFLRRYVRNLLFLNASSALLTLD